MDKLLDSFIAAVEEGSFTAAAKRLYISQPALSQQIAQLEDDVGFKLFLRINNTVRLTPGGKALYEGARRISNLYGEVLAGCREIAGVSETAPVRPCCSAGLDNTLNLRLFKEFRDRYPALKIDPHDTEAAKRVADVAENKADVAVYFPTPELDERGLEFHHLFYDRDYWAMSPDHPLAKKTAIGPEDLVGQRVFLNKDIRSRSLSDIRALLAGYGDRITVIPVALTASTVVAAIAEGGVTLLPGTSARAKKGVAIVPMDWDQQIEVGMICRPNPRAAVRSYIELAQQLFSNREQEP